MLQDYVNEAIEEAKKNGVKLSNRSSLAIASDIMIYSDIEADLTRVADCVDHWRAIEHVWLHGMPTPKETKLAVRDALEIALAEAQSVTDMIMERAENGEDVRDLIRQVRKVFSFTGTAQIGVAKHGVIER